MVAGLRGLDGQDLAAVAGRGRVQAPSDLHGAAPAGGEADLGRAEREVREAHLFFHLLRRQRSI